MMLFCAVEDGGEVGRKRRSNFDHFAGFRMLKAEFVRVKKKPLKADGFSEFAVLGEIAVHLIAGYGRPAE